MVPSSSLLATAALVATVACLPIDEESEPPITPSDPAYETTVQVKFLGVGGFHIRLGSDVIMTAPLYSNPGLLNELLTPIYPVADRLAFHPNTPDVKGIVVGHAHYDHLMDVPYIWQRTPSARIYGSQTMVNILSSYTLDQPPTGRFPDPIPRIHPSLLIPLDAKVDTRHCAGMVPSSGVGAPECAPYPAQEGRWEAVTPTLRIRAICARHPPQFLCFHQSPGCVEAPAADLPKKVGDYLEGPTYVYLIDFLDPSTKKPRFRVYYQDVPSDGLIGRVPEALFDGERRVDLALLCVGSWKQGGSLDSQEIIRNLRPRHVMLGHWEDFFRPQDRRLEPAPFQAVKEYYELVEKELERLSCPETPTLSLPKPQTQRNYTVLAGGCEPSPTVAQTDSGVDRRLDLLNRCGFDDWFHPVEGFGTEDAELMNALLSPERMESFSAEALRDSAQSGRPSACDALTLPPEERMAEAAELLPDSSEPEDCSPYCLFKQEEAPPGLSDHVRFAVIGDAGKANHLNKPGSILERVRGRVRDVCCVDAPCSEAASRPCDFALFLGDNLYPAGIARDRDADALGRLLDGFGLRAYPILGNHDWDPLWASRSRARRELAWIGETDGVFGNAHFYDFSAGPVHLWGIDSNYLVRKRGAESKLRDRPWVLGIGDTSAPWKIAFGHHGYLSNGPHGNAGDFDEPSPFWSGGSYKKFMDERVLGKVDLYLAGHDHNLQFFPDHSPDDARDTALVITGAGAKCNPRGKARNTGEGGSVAPAFEYYGPGFSLVEASDAELRLEMHRYESGQWVRWTAVRTHESGWAADASFRELRSNCKTD